VFILMRRLLLKAAILACFVGLTRSESNGVLNPQGVLALGIHKGVAGGDITSTLQSQRSLVERLLATHLRCEQISIEYITASEFGRVTPGEDEVRGVSELFLIGFRAQGVPAHLRGRAVLDNAGLEHSIQRSLSDVGSELLVEDVSVEWTVDYDNVVTEGAPESQDEESVGTKYGYMGAILLGSSATLLVGVSAANLLGRRGKHSSKSLVVDDGGEQDNSAEIETAATQDMRSPANAAGCSSGDAFQLPFTAGDQDTTSVVSADEECAPDVVATDTASADVAGASSDEIDASAADEVQLSDPCPALGWDCITGEELEMTVHATVEDAKLEVLPEANIHVTKVTDSHAIIHNLASLVADEPSTLLSL